MYGTRSWMFQSTVDVRRKLNLSLLPRLSTKPSFRGYLHLRTDPLDLVAILATSADPTAHPLTNSNQNRPFPFPFPRACSIYHSCIIGNCDPPILAHTHDALAHMFAIVKPPPPMQCADIDTTTTPCANTTSSFCSSTVPRRRIEPPRSRRRSKKVGAMARRRLRQPHALSEKEDSETFTLIARLPFALPLPSHLIMLNNRIHQSDEAQYPSLQSPDTTVHPSHRHTSPTLLPPASQDPTTWPVFRCLDTPFGAGWLAQR